MSQAVSRRLGALSRGLFVVLAFAIVIVDQATKAMVGRMIPEHAVIPVIPNFLNLTHTKNPGAAFGLFSDSPAPWKTALLVIISVALLLVVVSMVWRSPNLAWESGVGLAMVLGGAVSNLADRIRAGRVVDFLDVYFRSYHWWSFNVADSAIVVGAIFLVIHLASSK